MLGVYGPRHKYGDILENAGGLMHLFAAEPAECQRGKCMAVQFVLASTVGILAGHQCPTRVWISSEKVRRRQHVIVHYSSG